MRKILVVDDELAGLRKVHVEGTVPNFYETISDTTDPRFESLLAVAQQVEAARPFLDDHVSAADYFSTDEAVRDVLLSSWFDTDASPELKDLLGPFLSRSQRISQLRAHFHSAFPEPEFLLEFVDPPRPPLEKVTQCAAIFLDLFLEDNDSAPVDGIQEYLLDLSRNAGHERLPPIVIMSAHAAELNEHKRDFSERAQISAAGLMVLAKVKIAEPQFQSTGLRLSFDQLSRQSAVAHSMRLFALAWTEALRRATMGASKSIWNLDASAMQQIHLASVKDDDPYDEHLSELLGRDHLFRVESDSHVRDRIEVLDAGFRELLADNAREIKNRLIAPMTDVETSRALMSHFTWLGSLPTIPFLCYLDEECAGRISTSLPFGSVLCGGVLSDKTRCLIHITQQCDLNKLSRTKNSEGSLIFAVAEARELLASDNPTPDSKELVARSLQIIEGETRREFDLNVQVATIEAMSLRNFSAYARRKQLRVIGRLRSDITNQIVAATCNQLSRPAKQNMLRPGLVKAKVFLQSANLQGGKIALKETENAARIFSLMIDDDLYSFQDEACVDISLWLTLQLHLLNISINTDELCTALRKGWRTGQPLPGRIKFKVCECSSLPEAYKSLHKGDVSRSEVQLSVIFAK